MMVYFYTLLTLGAKLSRFPRSFLPQVEHLLSLGVLDKKADVITLQAPFILAVVQESLEGARGLVFAKSLNPSHKEDFLIQYSKSTHKGTKKQHPAPRAKLKRGDVILAIETKAKNRGIKARATNKPRARLVETLHISKPYTLAVLILQSELQSSTNKSPKSAHKSESSQKPQKITDKIIAIELKSKKKYDECDHIIDLKVSQKSLRALPRHCVVKIELSSRQIVEALGSLDDAHIDEILALNAYKIKTQFSQEALEFAHAFGQSIDTSMYPMREDLRHLDFCVIDPREAKDHDDAIYFDSKQRILYVAIADVSEYVSPNSALDKEARERGFSLYFPHKVLPMLPHSLSGGICSLKEGKDRLAMVWKITLSKEAKVLVSSLHEAIIKSSANVSYEQVQDFLDTKQSHHLPQNIAKWIKSYVPFVRRLREERLKQGCEFQSHEIRLILDENAQITSWHKETHNLSHSIIEESMLLANIQAATMLENAKKKGLITHGMYRIHPRPKSEKLNELLFTLRQLGFELNLPKLQSTQTKDTSDHALIAQIQNLAATLPPYIREVIDTLTIRSLAKATYGTDCLGHFALGFECYTHFTSPIRRYGDLIVHRILKALPKGEAKDLSIYSPSSQEAKQLSFITQDLHAIAQEINLKERQITHIEQDFFLVKITRLAAKLLESAKERGEELVLCAVRLNESLAIAQELIPQARLNLTHTTEAYQSINKNLEEQKHKRYRGKNYAKKLKGYNDSFMPLSLVYVQIYKVDLLRGHIYAKVLESHPHLSTHFQNLAPTQSPLPHKEER